MIKNRDKIYQAVIEGEPTVKWTRGFQAGVLEFNVVKDEIIDYQEGNSVTLLKGDKVLFSGYVFKKSRTGKQIIKTICYDSLRYMKNKDSMQFENKKYSEILTMICDDNFVELGDVDDTGYTIPLRTERDKEYFAMLAAASELTTVHTGKEYVLYDDCGKICLREWKNIPTTDTVICYDNTIDFAYSTSIDNAYNRVKVNYIDSETQKVESLIVEDDKNIKNWGRLQFFAETSTKENLDAKAKGLLTLLNRKERRLTLKNVVGDWRVRAGSLVPVLMEGIGDIDVNSMCLVHSVTHRIKGEYHFMDLEVYNKDIMPSASGGGAFGGAKVGKKVGNISSGAGGKRGEVLDYALSKEGMAYSQPNRFGDTSFDCSSLVLRSMRAAGLDSTGDNLTTRTIAKDRRFYEISKSDLQPGDVLWKPGHVALYTGGNGTIEAMNPKKGVRQGQVGSRFTRFFRMKGID